MRTFPTVAVMIAAIGLGGLAVPADGTSIASPADELEPVGGVGLRLAEAPLSAGDDPRARLYIVDHLAPGTVIERRVEVSNSTSSPQRVVLYSAAASIDDGSFLGAAGDTANELSTWTTVVPTTIVIGSGRTHTATVTVDVPSDAAPGEQYGVIWAEVRSEPSAEGGVSQVSRVGIRMYVSVGPGGAPAADFTIDTLTASRSSDEGLPVVSASVHNTGGRALDMRGTLVMSNGPGGLSAGPFVVDLGRTLAIGDTQDVHVTLDARLPAGPWDASITLTSGLTERTVEATITFPDEGATPPVDTRAAGSSTPWSIIALLSVVGLLAASGTGVVLRRRRRRRAAKRWAAPTGAAHGHIVPTGPLTSAPTSP